MAIETIRIHPAIGIARLGNSSTGFYIGPEIPGVSAKPQGGYKDAKRCIRRQAARFRLFGYDKNGKPLKEIDSKDASIKWTVHVANKKAAAKQFDGLNANTPLRNGSIVNRASLVIDPGSRSVNGPNRMARFYTGKFLGVKVPLGEIRTDSRGRLLVF